MKTTVGMVSLGCSKNQVDGELMLALMRDEGFVVTGNPYACDAVIINTCGFIEDAKRESIETILEFCQLKEEGVIKAVVVTGCLAERYQMEIAGEIPEADVVLGIGSNQKVVSAIKKALQGEKTYDFSDKLGLVMEGDRILVNQPFYAYVKVADGCDNRCSYCAIPGIRGRFRSRPMENIMEEVHRLVGYGVKEINLVAQDTTRYGEDLYGSLMLPQLIRQVCGVAGVKWVRVLYCYPQRVTDELLEVMASEPKVVKYMDIPLQHASGRVLSEMNRRGDAQSLRALMTKIRDKVPGIVLRTTMIVGFPGETEEDFTRLCDFIKEVRFERLGCFTYSLEEDTPAALMENQIEEETKHRRRDAIMTEQMGIAEAFGQSCVGRKLEIAVEGFDEEQGRYYGRSYMDAPDIDTRTYFTSDTMPLSGDFVPVLITGTMGYDLLGQQCE